MEPNPPRTRVAAYQQLAALTRSHATPESTDQPARPHPLRREAIMRMTVDALREELSARITVAPRDLEASIVALAGDLEDWSEFIEDWPSPGIDGMAAALHAAACGADESEMSWCASSAACLALLGGELPLARAILEGLEPGEFRLVAPCRTLPAHDACIVLVAAGLRALVEQGLRLPAIWLPSLRFDNEELCADLLAILGKSGVTQLALETPVIPPQAAGLMVDGLKKIHSLSHLSIQFGADFSEMAEAGPAEAYTDLHAHCPQSSIAAVCAVLGQHVGLQSCSIEVTLQPVLLPNRVNRVDVETVIGLEDQLLLDCVHAVAGSPHVTSLSLTLGHLGTISAWIRLGQELGLAEGLTHLQFTMDNRIGDGPPSDFDNFLITLRGMQEVCSTLSARHRPLDLMLDGLPLFRMLGLKKDAPWWLIEGHPAAEPLQEAAHACQQAFANLVGNPRACRAITVKDAGTPSLTFLGDLCRRAEANASLNRFALHGLSAAWPELLEIYTGLLARNRGIQHLQIDGPATGPEPLAPALAHAWEGFLSQALLNEAFESFTSGDPALTAMPMNAIEAELRIAMRARMREEDMTRAIHAMAISRQLDPAASADLPAELARKMARLVASLPEDRALVLVRLMATSRRIRQAVEQQRHADTARLLGEGPRVEEVVDAPQHAVEANTLPADADTPAPTRGGKRDRDDDAPEDGFSAKRQRTQ